MKGENKKTKKKQTTVKDLEACIKKKEERILVLERIQMSHKEHVKQFLWYSWMVLCGIITIIYCVAGYYLGQHVPMFFKWTVASTGELPTLAFIIIAFFIIMTSILTWWIFFKIFEGIEESL